MMCESTTKPSTLRIALGARISFSQVLTAFFLTFALTIHSAGATNVTSNATIVEDIELGYSYIVLQWGESVLLDCEHWNETYRWTAPNNSALLLFNRTHLSERLVRQHREHSKNTIMLYNAKDTDTGLYQCVDSDDHVIGEIYIYVNGSSFFLSHLHRILDVDTNDNFTVPCLSRRPLQERQQVILTVNRERWNSTDGQYDPRIGFKMSQNAMERSTTIFDLWECIIIGDYYHDSSQFQIGLPELSWNLMNEWPFEGGSLNLACELKFSTLTKKKLHLNVTCPRCKNNSTRIVDHLFGRIGKTISIEQLNPEDSGEYSCMWNESEGNSTLLRGTITKEVDVAPRKHQIRINRKSNVPAVLKDGGSLELFGNFSFYPKDDTEYTIKWIRSYTLLNNGTDEDVETVISNVTHTFEPEVRCGFYDEPCHQMQQAKLRIKIAKAGEFFSIRDDFFVERINISDLRSNMSGHYILMIIHWDEVRTVNWTLKIDSTQVTTKVTLSDNYHRFLDKVYYITGSKIGIFCIAESYPPANLTISRREEGSQSWETLHDLNIRYGSFEVGATTFISPINALVLTCTAEHGEMSANMTTLIRVIDAPPSAAVTTAKDDSAIDTDKHKRWMERRSSGAIGKWEAATIYEGDDVTLTCTVPADAEWKFEWRHRDKVLSETSFDTVGHMKQLKSTLHNVTTADNGNYFCMATNSNESMPIFTKPITVKSVQKPYLLQSSPSKTADWGTETVLECAFSAVPNVTVSWFQTGDDGKLEPVLTGNGRMIREDGKELKFEKLGAGDEGIYECQGVNRAGMASASMQLTLERVPETMPKYIPVIVGILLIILVTISIVLVKQYIRIHRKANDQRQSLMDFLYHQLMKGSMEPPQLAEGRELLDTRAHRTAYNTKYEIDEALLLLDANALGEGYFGYVKRSKLYKRFIMYAEGTEFLDVAVKKAKRSRRGALQALMHELKILVALEEYANGDPNPNVLALVGASTTNFRNGDLTLVFELCELGDLKNYLHSHRTKFVNQLVAHIDNEADQLLSEGGHFISTSDLLSIAMQVANGMEYLANVPCIHRDLAARNILLTKNLVVKVADFGLTRMDPECKYRANKKQALPIKWLALETLQTMKFTLETDIWSFGVVLYEIFTLGANPYPGHNFDIDQMATHLGGGTRLERPAFCHPRIYSLMRQSWDADPKKRPKFSHWHSTLKKHLMIASVDVFRQTEVAKNNAAKQLTNFAIYRGEGQHPQLRDSNVVSAQNNNYHSRSEGVGLLGQLGNGNIVAALNENYHLRSEGESHHPQQVDGNVLVALNGINSSREEDGLTTSS